MVTIFGQSVKSNVPKQSIDMIAKSRHMSKSLTRDDKKKQTSERISDIYEFTSDDNEGYEIMPKKRRRMRQQTKKKKRKKECWPIIVQPIEKERRKGRFTLKAKVRVGPNVQMNGIQKSGQSIVSSANGFASNISKRTFQNINKINEMATMQSDSLDSGADQSVGYSKPINGWIFNSKNVHSAKGDCLTKKRRQPMKLYSQDVIYCEYLESGDKETKASDQHCAQRTHLNVQSDVIAKQLSKLNGIVSECSENVCNIADVMMKNQCNRSNVSYSYRRQTSTKTNFTDDNLRSAFNWAHHDENNNNIASDEIFSLNNLDMVTRAPTSLEALKMDFNQYNLEDNAQCLAYQRIEHIYKNLQAIQCLCERLHFAVNSVAN